LVRYGTVADGDEIRDTAVAQPLLVSAGLAVASALFGPLSDVDSALPVDPGLVDATAGHSVGEFTAAAIRGSVSQGRPDPGHRAWAWDGRGRRTYRDRDDRGARWQA